MAIENTAELNSIDRLYLATIRAPKSHSGLDAFEVVLTLFLNNRAAHASLKSGSSHPDLEIESPLTVTDAGELKLAPAPVGFPNLRFSYSCDPMTRLDASMSLIDPDGEVLTIRNYHSTRLNEPLVMVAKDLSQGLTNAILTKLRERSSAHGLET